jgi:hypothetical protein
VEGSGEEPNNKLKRKWFWSGGRPRYEGDGAVEIILDFLQKKLEFRPKGTATETPKGVFKIAVRKGFEKRSP